MLNHHVGFVESLRISQVDSKISELALWKLYSEIMIGDECYKTVMISDISFFPSMSNRLLVVVNKSAK